MGICCLFRKVIGTALLVLLLAAPLAAQVEDHLSAYTGDNAEGYLDPLIGAIGGSMNAGLFRSAYIPKEGFTFPEDLYDAENLWGAARSAGPPNRALQFNKKQPAAENKSWYCVHLPRSCSI